MTTLALAFRAYNGMRFEVEPPQENADARANAARYLANARSKGHEVVTLERGERWEIQTQANLQGLFVTDEDGVLSMEPAAEPNDDEQEDDLYAFYCSTCGIGAFDGEGDGDECEDCHEESAQTELDAEAEDAA